MCLAKKVGLRIKTFRDQYGVSQSDLAEALGTKQQVISTWERGVYLVSFDILIKIKEIYGVPLDFFYPDNNENDVKEDLKSKNPSAAEADELKVEEELKKIWQAFGSLQSDLEELKLKVSTGAQE